MEKKQISFNKFYKLFNLVSFSLIIISILLYFFLKVLIMVLILKEVL